MVWPLSVLEDELATIKWRYALGRTTSLDVVIMILTPPWTNATTVATSVNTHRLSRLHLVSALPMTQSQDSQVSQTSLWTRVWRYRSWFVRDCGPCGQWTDSSVWLACVFVSDSINRVHIDCLVVCALRPAYYFPICWPSSGGYHKKQNIVCRRRDHRHSLTVITFKLMQRQHHEAKFAFSGQMESALMFIKVSPQCRAVTCSGSRCKCGLVS